MGANVGTTVTSTIVSLAQMGKSAELDRSFAAATLHDVFNIFTVAILFPVECATGYLQHLTGALAEGAETGRRDHFEGPIKKFVSPLSARLLTSNKKLIVGVANGKTCDDYYPIHCDEGAEPSFATCKVGLIGCYESTGRCPVLFRESASRTQDQVAGAVSFVIALIILFVSMLSMVFAVQKLLFGLSTKVVHTVTTCNGYIGFLVGIGITMITQSSSITTSVLVPFAGVGALRLEQVYPLVLGANMGTAVQAVVSSLDAVGTDPLQVALAHLFFNLTGFLIWYPLPPLRNIPFFAARRLGKNAGIWRMFPLCYIVLVFCLLPLFFWGLSSLYENGSAGLLAFAVLLTLVAGFALALLMFWCNFRNGQSKFHSILDRLSHRNDKPSQTYDAEGNFDIDADGDNVSGEKDTVENP
jgi:sodium-dependent phosphate cotransporter